MPLGDVSYFLAVLCALSKKKIIIGPKIIPKETLETNIEHLTFSYSLACCTAQSGLDAPVYMALCTTCLMAISDEQVDYKISK